MPKNPVDAATVAKKLKIPGLSSHVAGTLAEVENSLPAVDLKISPNSRVLALIEQRMRRFFMTQSELSQRSGIPQSNLSAIFSGKRRPTIRTVERMLMAIECNVRLAPWQSPDDENWWATNSAEV